jgi:hypothetical protein
MGITALAGVAAVGTPPAGDQANAVLSGSFSAVGPSQPLALWGSFNFLLWGSVNTSLTTTSGSLTASVVSGTGIAAGQAVNSVNVPPGTTWASFSGTSGTLALPPGVTSAAIVTGTDAAAIIAAVAWTGTVAIERSFDGGTTWLIVGVGGGGTGAVYIGATQAATPVSITGAEPERQVLYRANCTAYSGTVPINYRFSTTGAAATAWGIPAS